jgi:hypothetical protein
LTHAKGGYFNTCLFLKNKKNIMATETQLIQMRFLPETMQRLEDLRELTGVDNRTQIVSTAIQLAEIVIKSINKGGNVYIEAANGEMERIRFVGI